MTRPELGTKRICAGCNAKFYDLHKTPIICPMCEAVFVLPKAVPERPQRHAGPKPLPVQVVAAPKSEIVPEAPANADEDKDKEAEGGDLLLEEIDDD